MSDEVEAGREPRVHNSDRMGTEPDYRPAKGPLGVYNGHIHAQGLAAYFWERLRWEDQTHGLGLIADLRARTADAKPTPCPGGVTFTEFAAAITAWRSDHGLVSSDPFDSIGSPIWDFVLKGCPMASLPPGLPESFAPMLSIGPDLLAFIPSVEFQHQPWDAVRDEWREFSDQAVKEFKKHLAKYREQVMDLAAREGITQNPVWNKTEEHITWLIMARFRGLLHSEIAQAVGNSREAGITESAVSAGIIRAERLLGLRA